MTEPQVAMDNPEKLGEVTSPSGILVVLDTGLLNLWCHDRPPVLPENTLDSPEKMADANQAVDFKLEGADAREAGIVYDRSCHPLYTYDVPKSHVVERIEHFAAFAKEHGFDAQLVPLKRRITHRERISQLLEDGVAANGISFHGIWAAVTAGIPKGVKLSVYGRRRTAGTEFWGRWQEIYLEILPEAQVVRSELRGQPMVDYGGLIIADADALGEWVQEEPLDGKADFVFWGRDAEAAAREFKAPQLEEENYGWRDLPAGQVAELAQRVEALRETRGWHFATDFRPHSHLWQGMEQVRASETESGAVFVGGAQMCTFMTTWGDGMFDVYADFDEQDRLARLRVDLGSERTLERMRRVEERCLGEFAKMAIVTKWVFEEGQCVRFLYREAADREQDSGWRIFAGGESDEYVDDAKNATLVALRELLEREPELEALFRQPVGSVFERENCGDAFVAVTDWAPREED